MTPDHRPEPRFTIESAASLLHRQAYGTGPLADKAQYSALCEHLDSLSQMMVALRRRADGLELLLNLLRYGGTIAGMQQVHAEAVSGLLEPLSNELGTFSETLRAALGGAADPKH